MKKYLVFIIGLTSFLVNLKGQEISTKLDSVIQSGLEKVKKSAFSDGAIQCPSQVVSFFTNLTGIPSKTEGNYFGQINPSKEDYNNWLLWFEYNKEFLIFDVKKNEILLQKKLKLPTI